MEWNGCDAMRCVMNGHGLGDETHDGRGEFSCTIFCCLLFVYDDIYDDIYEID